MKEVKRKVLSIKMLIVLYCITSIMVINLTFSKYTSSTSMAASTTVAVMANSTEVNINETISGYPGCDPIICPIILTNKKGSSVCEVSQKFEIFIDKDNFRNLPIEFAMYKDEYCTEIINQDENGVFTSDEFIFNAGIEESKTFYMKIFWPKEIKDSSLAFEVDYFKIHIVATQID